MDYRKTTVFDYVNGFRIPKQFYLAPGSVPIPEKAVTVKDLFDLWK